MKNSFRCLVAFTVAGLGAVVSLPALAIPQAYVSGSATITLMDGATQSLGIEVGLPGDGSYFNTANTTLGVITPAFNGNTLSSNDILMTNLTIDVGDVVASSDGGTPTSFTAAAANVLSSAENLDEQVSIIRAGAGVDGLE